MTTSAQIRAARAMLGKSQEEIAKLAGVSVSTLKRAEGSIRPPASKDAMDGLRKALESFGAEFIPENGGGAGVRMRKEKNVETGVTD